MISHECLELNFIRTERNIHNEEDNKDKYCARRTTCRQNVRHSYNWRLIY